MGAVRTMGMDDNYHRILDANTALIDTPLIAPSHSYYPHHFKNVLYPYNFTSSTYHNYNNPVDNITGSINYGSSEQSPRQTISMYQKPIILIIIINITIKKNTNVTHIILKPSSTLSTLFSSLDHRFLP